MDKKRRIRQILISISLIVIFVMPFLVYADLNYENHNYEVVSIENGLIKVKCQSCKQEYTISLESVINERKNSPNYYSVIDANNDDIINAKDYAMIKRHLATTTTTTTTTAKSTTKPITDKDGYNNQILKP